MARIFRTAVLALAVGATTLAPVAGAFADEFHRPHHRRPVVNRPHHNGGDLLAAGILGVAIGAIIVGAANADAVEIEPRPRPHWDRYPSRPQPVEPQVITYDDSGWTPEPWTAEWAEQCADRYRTFDPRSGTYMAKSGKRKFCTLD